MPAANHVRLTALRITGLEHPLGGRRQDVVNSEIAVRREGHTGRVRIALDERRRHYGRHTCIFYNLRVVFLESPQKGLPAGVPVVSLNGDRLEVIADSPCFCLRYRNRFGL
jgi:hypothetical protein